jgi:hypothetical protein
MCLKKGCCNIEIIEIHNKVKVVLHYNKDGRPILIEYWNDNRNINESYKRIKKVISREVYLEKEKYLAKVKELIKNDILDLEVLDLI